MSSALSELTILGELGKTRTVELLSHSGAHCLLASSRAIAPGTVARIRTGNGVLLGEVVSCERKSRHFDVSMRALGGWRTERPVSVLPDLMSLNAHLMACEA